MSHPDAIVAALAARSYGVVTRTMLLRAGLTTHQITHRVRTGALSRAHPGVYRVGAPSVAASYLAATWACGPEAALGGLAAVSHFGLGRGEVHPPEVWAAHRRRLRGAVVRRGARDPADRLVWEGVPSVTVPRALVDVAGRLPEEALARVCHEATVRFGTTPAHVEAALSRWPTASGATKLRAVIGGKVAVSLSVLEGRFLALLQGEELALPVTNRPAGGFRIDCRWPAHRLTVELDSYRFHNSRHSWERDHQREREAYARGDAFRRYTWRDVMEDPTAMLRELHALLSTLAPGWEMVPPR